MQLEVRKLLYDVAECCKDIAELVQGRTLSEYLRDKYLRYSVERPLITIGEALNQAVKLDEGLEEGLPEVRRVIGLRHVLVHGYGKVQHDLIWGLVCERLPTLHARVTEMLAAP